MRRAKPKAKQQIEVRGPIPVRPQGQILVARRTMVIGHVLTSEALVREPLCFDGRPALPKIGRAEPCSAAGLPQNTKPGLHRLAKPRSCDSVP